MDNFELSKQSQIPDSEQIISSTMSNEELIRFNLDRCNFSAGQIKNEVRSIIIDRCNELGFIIARTKNNNYIQNELIALKTLLIDDVNGTNNELNKQICSDYINRYYVSKFKESLRLLIDELNRNINNLNNKIDDNDKKNPEIIKLIQSSMADTSGKKADLEDKIYDLSENDINNKPIYIHLESLKLLKNSLYDEISSNELEILGIDNLIIKKEALRQNYYSICKSISDLYSK
jgi:hypothetical protein